MGTRIKRYEGIKIRGLIVRFSGIYWISRIVFIWKVSCARSTRQWTGAEEAAEARWRWGAQLILGLGPHRGSAERKRRSLGTSPWPAMGGAKTEWSRRWRAALVMLGARRVVLSGDEKLKQVRIRVRRQAAEVRVAFIGRRAVRWGVGEERTGRHRVRLECASFRNEAGRGFDEITKVLGGG
jgi:hypothetical protein